MKLRIQDNNIRLRLTRGEVETIGHRLSVQGRTELFPTPLVYELQPLNGIADVTVSFEAGRLVIQVPVELAIELNQTDRVGIEADVRTSAQSTIEILIEKDFKCLHGEVPNQEECFVNPLAAD